MSSRFVKVFVGVIVGVFLAASIFTAGLAVGTALPRLSSGTLPFLGSAPSILSPSRSPTQENGATPAQQLSVEDLFKPFWDAWDIVHNQYVDPVDDVTLMRGAIRGMLESLGDPHTSYMDPDEYQQATIPLEGEYEGIGAWVDPEGEYLTIISPMPGSPAEEAGLKPGDQVIAVDGEDMTGVDGNIVIRHVLGPAGTDVELTIRREGESDPLTFDLTRRSITIPSVESHMLDGQIAYVHLFTFGSDTTQDLRSQLRTLMAQNPKGLILDLRGNGGGFLDTSVEVASEFIPNGVVLVEKFGDGTEQEHRVNSGGLATEVPMVVLIDGGTASASEIVAGAIQDHERGLLVGEVSFGKGSVQNWIPLPDDNGAVRVTIARWYTPGGRQISEKGLTPDVEVTQSEADTSAGVDTQLQQAIQTLMQEIQ